MDILDKYYFFNDLSFYSIMNTVLTIHWSKIPGAQIWICRNVSESFQGCEQVAKKYLEPAYKICAVWDWSLHPSCSWCLISYSRISYKITTKHNAFWKFAVSGAMGMNIQ